MWPLRRFLATESRPSVGLSNLEVPLQALIRGFVEKGYQEEDVLRVVRRHLHLLPTLVERTLEES